MTNADAVGVADGFESTDCTTTVLPFSPTRFPLVIQVADEELRYVRRALEDSGDSSDRWYGLRNADMIPLELCVKPRLCPSSCTRTETGKRLESTQANPSVREQTVPKKAAPSVVEPASNPVSSNARSRFTIVRSSFHTLRMACSTSSAPSDLNDAYGSSASSQCNSMYSAYSLKHDALRKGCDACASRKRTRASASTAEPPCAAQKVASVATASSSMRVGAPTTQFVSESS